MSGWILLTGEYPPAEGGVADYTRRLATALAEKGDEVEVWAPSIAPLASDDGVVVRALPDRFGPRSLSVLQRELAHRAGARVLVQWVPNAFGMRAMNLPFCVWLAARRGPTWVMFHEVSYAFERSAKWTQNVLALATSAMGGILASRADRSFVSTPAWNARLRHVAPFAPEPTWLPIPSNLPEHVEAEAVARARARLGLNDKDIVVGSFGTYGPRIAPHVATAFSALLATDESRVALVMGRGSREFVERSLRPKLTGRARVIATGDLASEDLVASLAACTALVQPYSDGVTARRTSAMAGLALGVPILTNEGPLTEAIWRDEGAVLLASSPEAIADESEGLLGDRTRLDALGAKGRDVYRRRFSLAQTVRVLRQPTASS